MQSTLYLHHAVKHSSGDIGEDGEGDEVAEGGGDRRRDVVGVDAETGGNCFNEFRLMSTCGISFFLRRLTRHDGHHDDAEDEAGERGRRDAGGQQQQGHLGWQTAKWAFICESVT